MPAIHRYDVDITLTKKNVVATSAEEALGYVEQDIRVGKDIDISKVVVERSDG